MAKTMNGDVSKFYPGRMVYVVRDTVAVRIDAVNEPAQNDELFTSVTCILMRRMTGIVLYASLRPRVLDIPVSIIDVIIMFGGRPYRIPSAGIEVLDEETNGTCNGWKMKVADNRR